MTDSHLIAALDDIDQILHDYDLVGVVAIASEDGTAGHLIQLQASFSNILLKGNQFMFDADPHTNPDFDAYIKKLEQTEDALKALTLLTTKFTQTLQTLKKAHNYAAINLINELNFKADLKHFIANEN